MTGKVHRVKSLRRFGFFARSPDAARRFALQLQLPTLYLVTLVSGF